jgi:tellurite resistance protein TerB
VVLGLLKKLGGDAVKKYSGNKDFLEAVCASAALVAAADGSVSDDEILAAVEAARNNPTLTAA